MFVKITRKITALGLIGALTTGAADTSRLVSVLEDTLVFDGTEQQLAFDPAKSAGVGLAVNPSGSATLAAGGLYQGVLSLHVNKAGGQGLDVAVWIEVKPVSTGVWALLTGTMSNPVFHDDGGQSAVLTGSVLATAGDELRLMVKAVAGAGQVETISHTVSLGGLKAYAANLSIFRVGSTA